MNEQTTYPATAPSVAIVSANPDTAAPEIDLNRVSVSAAPTNPDSPNGETAVTIVFWARDDKSGLGTVNYRLLDPQGRSHSQWHYHDNFYTRFFEGDPTAWAEYTVNVLLPVGSAPGTWGLQSITLEDKAGNTNPVLFTENIHFESGNGRRARRSFGVGGHRFIVE